MSIVDPKDMGTAVGRWAGLGPYYAMFPLEFAFDVVSRHCPVGGLVLDPFAGRGTSIVAATAQGRGGLGVEINPVGWVYGQAKLHPASMGNVLRRLVKVAEEAPGGDSIDLPEFFDHCFAPATLRFLCHARGSLDWRHSKVDRTLMALILVYLHGKEGSAFSNQMRQGKSMAPDYSVRWWQTRDSKPPVLDPVQFLTQRVEWRYKKGVIAPSSSKLVLGDARKTIAEPRLTETKFDFLLTSPPYCGVTNYHYDQWLRLWMLGGPPKPTGGLGPYKGRFDSQADYTELLQTVFMKAAQQMKDCAKVYVRTDARDFTLSTTVEALRKAFPRKSLRTRIVPLNGKSQTRLFGDTSPKPGEVDILLA